MHNVLVAASALLLAHCGASPIAALKARQSCPEVHVFGARETTAPAGYGTASVVVDLVLGAYSGATSEAIDYPAWYVMRLPFRIATAADYLLVEDKLLVVATPTVLLWSRASVQSPQL
jgi:hypothetical protein